MRDVGKCLRTYMKGDSYYYLLRPIPPFLETLVRPYIWRGCRGDPIDQIVLPAWISMLMSMSVAYSHLADDSSGG